MQSLLPRKGAYLPAAQSAQEEAALVPPMPVP